MPSLIDIQAALKPFAEIGKGEETFVAGDHTVTIRVLEPDEEIQVQRYARAALAEGEATDQTSALAYLDRFRDMTLSFSLVQIDGLDLRDVTTVETGQKLPNGVAVRVKKHEALLGIITPWARPLKVAIFRKFGDLSSRKESDIDQLIHFEEVDYDAEILRLEERIADLKEQKARHDLTQSDPRTSVRDRVAGATTTSFIREAEKVGAQGQSADPVATPVVVEAPHVAPVADIPKTVSQPETEPPPVTQTPPARVSVLGTVAPPAPAPTAPVVGPQPPPTLDIAADVDTSFPDVSNPDVLAMESRRLMERRTPTAVAPHVSAREAFREVAQGGPQQSPPPPGPVGSIGGVGVYQMPTQNLSDREAPTPVRPAPTTTVNPKFRPAK